MAKATKKRPTGKAPSARHRHSRNKPSSARQASRQTSPRADTKQSRAIALLRSTKGASIAALMEATGWQQHSVRGFLAGVVRKRLGLELESSKVDGTRVYRIACSSSGQSRSASASGS